MKHVWYTLVLFTIVIDYIVIGRSNFVEFTQIAMLTAVAAYVIHMFMLGFYWVIKRL